MDPREREIVHIYPRGGARGSIYIKEKIGVARQRQSLCVARDLSGIAASDPEEKQWKTQQFSCMSHCSRVTLCLNPETH